MIHHEVRHTSECMENGLSGRLNARNRQNVGAAEQGVSHAEAGPRADDDRHRSARYTHGHSGAKYVAV